MLRRPFNVEPKSRLAAWSAAGWPVCARVAALSITMVRSKLLEIEPALATFAAALVFAGFAILLAFPPSYPIWRQGRVGLGRRSGDCFSALPCSPIPAILATAPSKLPAIYDITTDPANPPRFDALGAPAPARHQRLSGPASSRAQQRAAYPDIEPLQYDAPPQARLRYRAGGRQQAQMARRRCAAAAPAAARH